MTEIGRFPFVQRCFSLWCSSESKLKNWKNDFKYSEKHSVKWVLTGETQAFRNHLFIVDIKENKGTTNNIWKPHVIIIQKQINPLVTRRGKSPLSPSARGRAVAPVFQRHGEHGPEPAGTTGVAHQLLRSPLIFYSNLNTQFRSYKRLYTQGKQSKLIQQSISLFSICIWHEFRQKSKLQSVFRVETQYHETTKTGALCLRLALK